MPRTTNNRSSKSVGDGRKLDVVTTFVSIFARAHLLPGIRRAESCRVVLPADLTTLSLLGSAVDRSMRNQLQSRWLAVGRGAAIRDLQCKQIEQSARVTLNTFSNDT